MKITLENGDSLEISKESYEELAKACKPKLPESYESIGSITGFYIDDTSVLKESSTNARRISSNTFATKKQAESALAMAQLSQLLKVYNDDWIPDWNSGHGYYTILREGNSVLRDTNYSFPKFLAFKTLRLRNHFFEHHIALIKQYLMVD